MTSTETAGAARSSPVVFSPYDYAIHEDPYPTYARMREEAPVYRNDELDFFALSRHSDVVAAFRDPSTLLEPQRSLARPLRVRPARAQVDVVPRDGPSDPHTYAPARLEGIHAQTDRRPRTADPRYRKEPCGSRCGET